MKYLLIFLALVTFGASCSHPNETTYSDPNKRNKLTDTIPYKNTKNDRISETLKKESQNDNMDMYIVTNPKIINGSFIKSSDSRIKTNYLVNYSNYIDGYSDSIVSIYHGAYDKDAVHFENSIISVQGDEVYDGIFVWEVVRDTVELVDILDLALYSGSMMSNQIDTIIRLDTDNRLIFGKRKGGDEEDIYETVWIGLWSHERSFKILDFYNITSAPIQSSNNYKIENLAYKFNSVNNSIIEIELNIERKISNRNDILKTENILDTILTIPELLEIDSSIEFNKRK